VITAYLSLPSNGTLTHVGCSICVSIMSRAIQVQLTPTVLVQNPNYTHPELSCQAFYSAGDTISGRRPADLRTHTRARVALHRPITGPALGPDRVRSESGGNPCGFCGASVGSQTRRIAFGVPVPARLTLRPKSVTESRAHCRTAACRWICGCLDGRVGVQ